jgi:hypothetical protein
MVSFLFAGIPSSLSSDRMTAMPGGLTRKTLEKTAGRWPDISRNAGRLHIGTPAGFRLESEPASHRNLHAEPAIRAIADHRNAIITIVIDVVSAHDNVVVQA